MVDIPWGLTHIPDHDPKTADRDHLFTGGVMPFIPPSGFFSTRNAAALRAVMMLLRPSVVVEIGVGETETSSTRLLLSMLPAGGTYVGIDLHDKDRGDNVTRWTTYGNGKSAFFQSDSGDFDTVVDWLRGLRCLPIDLLFIDGKHSVSQCLADWRYARCVRPGGVVVLHDVNYHPGPRLLMEAVDRILFDVVDLFPPTDAERNPNLGTDYGMALLQRTAPWSS